MFECYKYILQKDLEKFNINKQKINDIFDHVKKMDKSNNKFFIIAKLFTILYSGTYTGKNSFYLKYLLFNDKINAKELLNMNRKQYYPEIFDNEWLTNSEYYYLENMYLSEVNIIYNIFTKYKSLKDIKYNEKICKLISKELEYENLHYDEKNNHYCFQWDFTFFNDETIKTSHGMICNINGCKITKDKDKLKLCFSYNKMIDTFYAKEPINPYTRKIFNADFYINVQVYYKKELNMYKKFLNLLYLML